MKGKIPLDFDLTYSRCYVSETSAVIDSSSKFFSPRLTFGLRFAPDVMPRQRALFKEPN